MNKKVSFNAIARLITSLTDEEQHAIVEEPELFKQFAAKLVADLAANTYVVALSDSEAVDLLAKNRGYNFADYYDQLLLEKYLKRLREEARILVAKWRKLASDLGYTGPVAWQVRAGFTLKQHAPQAGPCYDQFDYLQDWEFKNDEPTADLIVFWVPRLLEGSVSKDVEEQKVLMKDVRARYELPEHHMSSFGSAALIAGLILAHFKRTGERTPLRTYYVRTDTDHKDRGVVLGGFDSAGIRCDHWRCVEEADDADEEVGFFPLGVELLPAKNVPNQESQKS
jgi:hypothetical protein